MSEQEHQEHLNSEKEYPTESEYFIGYYRRTLDYFKSWLGVDNLSPSEASHLKKLVKEIIEENERLMEQEATPEEKKTDFYMENETIERNWLHVEKEAAMRWLHDLYNYDPMKYILGDKASLHQTLFPERSFFVRSHDGTEKEFPYTYPRPNSKEEQKFFAELDGYKQYLDENGIKYKVRQGASSKLQQEIRFLRDQAQNL
jgi:hypothetical protein